MNGTIIIWRNLCEHVMSFPMTLFGHKGILLLFCTVLFVLSAFMVAYYIYVLSVC